MATDFHPRHLCRNCGIKFEEHLDTQQDKCPATYSWGRIRPFPKWPKTLKDHAKAGLLFDKRLAKYWTSNTTHFQPLT